MATLTIQVEDNSVMAGLKKVLEAMKGVVIVPNHQKSMSGIEEAMDDIRHGRVTGCVCNEMTAKKVCEMKKCSNSLYI